MAYNKKRFEKKEESSDPPLWVCVEAYTSLEAYERGDDPIIDYVMNHNCEKQRGALGQQCREAFLAGQMVVSFARPSHDTRTDTKTRAIADKPAPRPAHAPRHQNPMRSP